MKFTSVIFLVLLHFFPAEKNISDWEFQTEDEGIQVFTRLQKNNPIKEVRITLEVDASMKKVRKVLSDVPSYTQWIYKCINPKRLQTLSQNDFYYYVETDLPFPLSNRDLIVFSQVQEDSANNGFISKSIGVPNYLPKKKDKVRMPFYQSQWIIQPRSEGKLLIDYQVKVDPGGRIPAWITNIWVTVGPLETMKSFRDLVNQSK